MFEQGDFNYSAYVPDVPGCITVGDTLTGRTHFLLKSP